MTAKRDAVRFEVEWVSSARWGTVIARPLDEGDFELDESGTLHGCPVVAMALPRALDAKGQQRDDLFAFDVARSSSRSTR